MMRPVKTLLHGLADRGQAEEAGALGVDGAVIELGDGRGMALTSSAAVAVVSGLPPLMARLVLLRPDQELPRGVWGAVTELGQAPPEEAFLHILRVEQEHLDPERIPLEVDALWVRPAQSGTAAVTRFDFRAIERLSFRHRIILELPDGAAGVETAIRLARPYAVLFGACVWQHPGIIDFERLEAALAVVARMNKRVFNE